MGLVIRWFPPAWVQIKSPRRTTYIDPAYLSSYYNRHPSRIEFSRWPDPIDGLPEELAPADLVLVTHGHKDHCKSVTIRRLIRRDTLVLAPRRCAAELGRRMQPIAPGDEIVERGLRIRAVEAYNTPVGASIRKVHRKGQGVGYVLRVGSKTIYHAGDTDFIPEMNDLGEVDVALLPIGGRFTMDVREVVAAALAIRPKVVIPMHHLRADPRDFKRRLEARSGIRVALLDIGETLRLE